MKEILKKIGIIDALTIQLELDRNEFLKKLSDHTEESNLGFGSSFFEVFSSNKKEFKGSIGINDFKIRKRRKFFDRSSGLAIATGKIHQKENTTIVETEISSFKNNMYFFLGFLILIYIVVITSIIFNSDDNLPVFIIPFILLHGLLMFGIPIFMLRKSTARLKKELEKDFYFIVKK
ncbi:MAG: hypothetical protein WAO74_10265 [Polaribacter sp.]|uniref:hypothetical protein n=1 Tax=Polaribacter sp. TaxID=1920175 RepID=UPI003BAE93A1